MEVSYALNDLTFFNVLTRCSTTKLSDVIAYNVAQVSTSKFEFRIWTWSLRRFDPYKEPMNKSLVLSKALGLFFIKARSNGKAATVISVTRRSIEALNMLLISIVAIFYQPLLLSKQHCSIPEKAIEWDHD